MNGPVSFAIAVPLLLIAATSPHAEDSAKQTIADIPKHIMATPEAMEWGACPPMLPPGAECTTIQGDPQVANELYAIRAKMPDGFTIPAHTHPEDEHLTVISGTFTMGLGEGFDEKVMEPMTVGSYMVMPKGVPHFALTRGVTVLQVHGIGPLDFIYVNPEDDPRNH